MAIAGDLRLVPVEPKSIEQSFADWEGDVFGFGYGTGEEHTIPALKTFFEAIGVDDRPSSYDYTKLEAACGPAVAWLLVNALCHAGIIEYGTSPRFAWLTKEGEALKAFMATKTADELYEICASQPEDYVACYPNACNCGPNGYEKGRKCTNPFWR